jgi:hypothetical protein
MLNRRSFLKAGLTTSAAIPVSAALRSEAMHSQLPISSRSQLAWLRQIPPPNPGSKKSAASVRAT